LEKIDSIDKKILYHLYINSRQSYSQIGKKVGLHRNHVIYRINNLVKKGIIKNFYTFINSNRLDYTGYRLYISYQNITRQKENEIIDFCVKNKNTWWVISGDIHQNQNLALLLWIKTIDELHIFMDQLFTKYRYYINTHILAVYQQLIEYEHTFLIDNVKKDDRINFQVTSDGNTFEIDKYDKQILKIISNSARIPTVEISKKIGLTALTISRRIKKMEKNKIIQGYKINIDYTKIGYILGKVNINLLDYKKRKYITKYIASNPNLKYIAKSLGYVDLELGFLVENIEQFDKIIEDILNNFSESIKEYNTLIGWKNHKIIYLPENI
jgi:Lrp/AsnC family transcriptional regulator, leucine-responsive regulatory protein